MSPPLSRLEAARVLGIPSTADTRAVKQAYRRLAREHHPDRGGDATTFDRLQRAYDRLVDDGSPPPPTVSRGRPSRPPTPFSTGANEADTNTVDWDLELATDAPLNLSRERLAVLLAGDRDGRFARVVATSRAPGSRLNRVAASLTPSARLQVAPATDDRGANVVRIEIRGSTRRARRALDNAALDGSWTRTRGSSSTTLRATIAPTPSLRATALRTADVVGGCLDRAGWPLSEWTTMSEGR